MTHSIPAVLIAAAILLTGCATSPAEAPVTPGNSGTQRENVAAKAPTQEPAPQEGKTAGGLSSPAGGNGRTAGFSARNSYRHSTSPNAGSSHRRPAGLKDGIDSHGPDGLSAGNSHRSLPGSNTGSGHSRPAGLNPGSNPREHRPRRSAGPGGDRGPVRLWRLRQLGRGQPVLPVERRARSRPVPPGYRRPHHPV